MTTKRQSSIFLLTALTPFREHFFQFTFDFEAGRSRNIFQIEAAVRGFQTGDGGDKFIGIGASFGIGDPVQADRNGINVGEVFEKHRFAFHHRQSGFRTDIAQTKYGGPVAYHSDHIAPGGIFPDILGVLFDRQTRLSHTGGVSETEVIAGGA